MNISNSKSRIIIFSKKTITLFFKYRIWESDITHRDLIKDFLGFIESKLSFLSHVDDSKKKH